MNKIYDLTIIGAGAAGLFASNEYLKTCRVHRKKPSLAIVEKNDEAAKKIYATGNGRCNFLNADASEDVYNDPEYVGKIFSEVYIDDLLDEFSDLGILPTEEDDGRMYPRSKEAASIAHALIGGAQGADFYYGFEVTEASKEDDIFIVRSRDGKEIRSKKLMIATGGKAGIKFGSDGMGFKLAKAFGHTVIKPVPALVPMTTDADLAPIAGVRTEAMINLVSDDNGKKSILAFEYFGEVQFTKDAISGICIMDLSRWIRLGDGITYTLSVDPLWDFEKEDKKVIIQAFPLEYLVPAKLAAYMHEHMQDDCTLKFNITGTKGWPDAQVTSGGVATAEINPLTMESTKVPGLYFAGEVIDVDGPCGGYNLSFVFASAYLAGSAAAVK